VEEGAVGRKNNLTIRRYTVVVVRLLQFLRPQARHGVLVALRQMLGTFPRKKDCLYTPVLQDVCMLLAIHQQHENQTGPMCTPQHLLMF
jgi:hypothetical protein